ncbi:MAG TPA: TIR domain-containing protein [Bacteroides sp.]|nr:TIR domain-containing protein [Bacteroides sp.]
MGQHLISLKRLESIDLSYNNLGILYTKLFEIEKLKALILNHNSIKNLPRQIGKLINLKKLCISNNYLKNLPVEIGNLDSLKSLNISKNQMREFPLKILSLENLEILWIDNNSFETFPTEDILNKLTKLRSIYCYSTLKSTMNNLNRDYFNLTMIRGNSIQALKYIKQKNLKKSDDKKIKTPIKKRKIFICYSHNDNKIRERVEIFLQSMQYEGLKFDFWSDQRIKPGTSWKQEIRNALNESSVAILIISSDFLASDFIRSDELPNILKKAENEGIKIISIIAAHCRFKKLTTLSKFQAVNDPSQPLNSMKRHEQDNVYLNMTYVIDDLLKN